MVYILNGMKMDRSKKKEVINIRMGKMDYGLIGILMDRRCMKKLTRMGKKMKYGLIGITMVVKSSPSYRSLLW